MLLESGQELVYIVLSLSILWFTVFLCWLLYQAARLLKNANHIIENVNTKIELITDAIEFIRERIDGMTSRMGVVSTLMTTLVEKFVLGKLNTSLDTELSKQKKKSSIKKK